MMTDKQPKPKYGPSVIGKVLEVLERLEMQNRYAERLACWPDPLPDEKRHD